MAVLYLTHEAFLAHDTGPGHPERAERLRAVDRGIASAGLGEGVVRIEPSPAPAGAVARVHPGRYLQALEERCITGGGHLDPDTVVSGDSCRAALLAAGAGLEAIRRLDAGEADAAFCAVRPPGHHALPARAMGFCLVNNVSVAAAELADRGERVLVVDYDAHHGNGTQEIFYDDPRILYVSIHQWPFYPGTGALDETGAGAGEGTTLNIPVPAGATGDIYRRAFDEIVAPAVERFRPAWVLASVGFDAHRADPLTVLGLSAGDYADLAVTTAAFAPAGRRLFFLEGGYDLDAVEDCAGATVAALAGIRHRPEQPTAGGPGEVVLAALRERAHQAGA